MQKANKGLSIRWMVLLAASIILLLIIYTAFDINGNRRELEQLVEKHSRTIITILQKSSENNISSFENIENLIAEKLLAVARLSSELYKAGHLTDSLLVNISNENDIFRITLYDAQGNLVLTNRSGGWGARTAPPGMLQGFETANSDELVLGFRGGRFGVGKRFAVAKKTFDGGAIFVNIDSERMLDFRKSIGLGQLLNSIAGNKGIDYILLQDMSKVVAASPAIDSISTIASDPFLSDAYFNETFATRNITFNEGKVIEVVQPFYLQYGAKYLLRIGTSAEYLVSAQKKAIIRSLLSSFVILGVLLMSLVWLFTQKMYTTLRHEYEKMQSYTEDILKNMRDAVIAIDKHEKLALTNQAAQTMFGLRSKQAISSDAITSILPYFKKALNANKNMNWEEVSVKIDEQLYIVSISINLIYTEKGYELAFAVIKDITRQKKLEENLKRQESINAMGHLAAGVAHEIRNPLNAISMLSQRLEAEFTPVQDATEYKKLALTIVNESARINTIIQRFLEYTRPAKLVKQQVNLNKVVGDIVSLLNVEASNKKIKLTASCKDIYIEADVEKLKQVLINILKNSFDACTDNGYVKIQCDTDQTDVMITIRDNGKGMKKETLNKIFNLYYTTREDGNGLGLSIVQQIISQHDGDIQVDSELNKGTSFTLRLPMGNIHV